MECGNPRRAPAHPGRVRIICPFIKASALSRVLSAARIDDVEVITRFDHGVSDSNALERIVGAGGNVRGVKGLHSKLYLFGEAVAIATSANVTDAAFHRNYEFGFVSTNLAIVATCEAYFDKLWNAAEPLLKAKQLSGRVDALKTAKSGTFLLFPRHPSDGRICH